MSDLCWKCKEKYEEILHLAYQQQWDLQWRTGPTLPWVHCHHEPKEKEKCWCKYPQDERNSLWLFKGMIEFQGKFCPECGRLL